MWETVRDRLPVRLHLVVALTILYGLTLGTAAPPPGLDVDPLTVNVRALQDLSAVLPAPAVVLGPLCGAVALALGATCLRELGVTPLRSVLWAVMVGGTTLWWPLSRRAGADGPSAVLLTALLLTALVWRRRPRRALVPVVVLLVIAAAGLRPLLVLTAPVVVAFMLSTAGYGRRVRVVGGVVCAVLALVLAVVLTVAVAPPSVLGDFLGRSWVWRTVSRTWALLAAPGRAAVLYSPLLLAAVLGVAEMRRRDRDGGGLVAGLSLVTVAAFLVVGRDLGSPAWVEEPVAVALPLMAMPAAFYAPRRRWVLGALLLAGLGVQGVALSLDYGALYRTVEIRGSSGGPPAPCRVVDALVHPGLCPLRLGSAVLMAKAGLGEHGGLVAVEVGQDDLRAVVTRPVQDIPVHLWVLHHGDTVGVMAAVAMAVPALLLCAASLAFRLAEER